jgi:hypothetical protein
MGDRRSGPPEEVETSDIRRNREQARSHKTIRVHHQKGLSKCHSGRAGVSIAPPPLGHSTAPPVPAKTSRGAPPPSHHSSPLRDDRLETSVPIYSPAHLRSGPRAPVDEILPLAMHLTGDWPPCNASIRPVRVRQRHGFKLRAVLSPRWQVPVHLHPGDKSNSRAIMTQWRKGAI